MAGIWDCVRNVFDDNVAAKQRADSLMWVVNPSLTPEDRQHIAEIFDKQLALYDGKMTRVEAHEQAFLNTRVQMEREGIRLNGQHAARYRQPDEITSGQLIHFRDGYETYKEAFEWRVSRSDRTLESLQRIAATLRGIVKDLPKNHRSAFLPDPDDPSVTWIVDRFADGGNRAIVDLYWQHKRSLRLGEKQSPKTTSSTPPPLRRRRWPARPPQAFNRNK
jgi:hypothetical protein